MAPIILYGNNNSPLTRSTLMTVKALGISLDFKFTDQFGGDTRTPEYLKINPQHTVPTLDDNGLIITDSHAIIVYLANQFRNNTEQPLYPIDYKERALVDQRLFFDTGVMFPRFVGLVLPIAFEGKTSISAEAFAKADEAYGFLDAFLTNSKWLAGDKLTVADISLIATVTSADILVPIDNEKYPKLAAWVERCKAETWYKENLEGLEKIKELKSQLI